MDRLIQLGFIIEFSQDSGRPYQCKFTFRGHTCYGHGDSHEIAYTRALERLVSGKGDRALEMPEVKND